jgi:hypothetical protein
MPWIFITIKNALPLAGFEPMNLGPSGKHTNHYITKDDCKKNILPLASKFLFSILSFLVDNMEKFQTNSYIRSTSTRCRYNLHVPYIILSKYKKEFIILELS